jgi:hypothetical protein
VTRPPLARSVALRASVLRTAAASAVPRLTGCSWRAEHTAAASHDRGTGAAAPPPTFSLTLHTAPSAAAAAGDAGAAAQGGAISLRLSVEQMQHLAFTLRDALHAAEREAGGA